VNDDLQTDESGEDSNIRTSQRGHIQEHVPAKKPTHDESGAEALSRGYRAIVPGFKEMNDAETTWQIRDCLVR
jgi:hypothetical protein